MHITVAKILTSAIVALGGLIFVSTVHAAAWNISDATYSGNSISVSPATSPAGMFVSSDGTKVYISNFSNQTIYQYSMSTGWDITTLSYESKSVSVSAQGSPDDVALSADGTKMFILSFYDYTVRQYTLSTPWDISTATYDTVSLALGAANHYDFSVKRDGTRLYSLNDYNNRIQQYSLSSAWDLSSQSAGTNYSYPFLNDGQELVFTLSDNGENMYIGTATNERIHWFTLSTPWDTSTASYSGSYKSISSEDAAMRKIFFNPTGTIMLALGQVNDKIYEYTLVDNSAPVVNSLSPADNATSVDVDANLVITFDEAVDVETGNITIKKTSDDSTIETIDVTSGQVTGTGTSTITINPSVTLSSETEYYVLIDATAFDDSASNSYVGISSTTAWSFTTADVVSPTISSLSPVDNATSVAIDSNLVITFNEAVDVETGNITLYKTSDDSEGEAIDVTSGQVTGTGTTTITINPTVNLDGETEYYVLVDTTAFDDPSGNSFAGVSTTTVWSFTTADVSNPTVSILSPSDNATDVSISSNLVITFNEAVDVESGNITIKKTSDDSEVEAIDVTSDKVTGTGTSTITINPSADFGYSTEYYVLIDATAFDDPSSNSYAGISSTTAWSFTTTAEPAASYSGGGGGFVSLPSLAPSLPTAGIAGTLNIGQVQVRPTTFNAYVYSTTKFQALTSSKRIFTQHEIILKDLDLLNNKLEVLIKSEPVLINLSLGESSSVDIDGDKIDDINIEFSELDKNMVIFNIQSLSQDYEMENEQIAEEFCTDIFKTELKYGMVNDDVKKLQEYLNANNFILATDGYGSPGNETDYFGKLTQTALRNYQLSLDINATGELDAETRDVINCKVKKEVVVNDTEEESAVIFSKDLLLGVSDPQVKKLQQFLNQRGFTVASTGSGSKGEETDFFGQLTKRALIDYQLSRNIKPALGYFGELTRTKISEE